MSQHIGNDVIFFYFSVSDDSVCIVLFMFFVFLFMVSLAADQLHNISQPCFVVVAVVVFCFVSFALLSFLFEKLEIYSDRKTTDYFKRFCSPQNPKTIGA